MRPPLNFLIFFLTLLFWPTLLHAKTIFVDANASDPTPDGTIWVEAFPTLQDALAVALSGDEIQVAEGTYYPDEGGAAVTGDRSSTFTLSIHLSILGGYPAGGGTRDPEANPTILSGDIGVGGDNSDNAYHVLVLDGTSLQPVLLDGLTISDGNADGSNPANRGGGIYCTATHSPVIKNCSILGSRAVFGGGIFNNSSSPTFTNCSFEGNSGRLGGGMTNDNASPTLTNCFFQGNSASDDGGGIYSFESSSSLTNCSFQGNHASRNGGGIYNSSSSPELTNCILWNNAENGDPNISGASVFNNSSTPTYSHCLLAHSGGSTSWDPAFGTDLGNNIDSDPLFVLEVDPLTAPHTGGDLRILCTSPAIDAGDNSANSELTDLAGNPRNVDGNADTTATIDLGAYEGPLGAIVTNLDDSGSGSLRDALTTSAAGSTICFDPSLDGGTISLSGGQLLIKQDLAIDASTLPNGLTIDPQQASRVLEVTSGAEVLLSDLTITGGRTPDGDDGADRGNGVPGDPGLPSDPGGGIYNAGSLTLNRVTLHACSTGNGGKGGDGGSGILEGSGGPGGNSGDGAGIYNAGALTINNSTIVDNSTGNAGNGGAGFPSGAGGSGGSGGGIHNNGTLTINHATIAGNTTGTAGTGIVSGTDGIGGGIFHVAGDLTLSGTVIAENTAPGGSPDLDGTVFAYPTMNFIGDSTGATGLGSLGTDYLEGDPQLGPLQDNGGLTATRAPIIGSPLIDPIGGDAAPALTTDQRGAARLFGTTADIGAVEIFAAYVDHLADGNDDGSSWSNAYPKLQDALTGPHPATVLIAQGTYYPDEGTAATDSDRSSTFSITSNIDIYGGYPTGGGTRDPDTYPTILSGDLNQDDDSGGDNSDNAYHVLVLDDGDDSTFQDILLDGLTITGGYANGATPDNRGGGINTRENLILNQVSISGNVAARYGGGVAVELGSSTFQDCLLDQNISKGNGGGAIRINDASLNLNNCDFTGNQANGSGGDGGAVRTNTDSILTIDRCHFESNFASNYGGAIYCSAVHPSTLTNCSFQANSAGFEGGGLRIYNSSPLLTNCAFQGNRADYGGGLSIYNSSALLKNCSFQGNFAEDGGGGMDNYSTTSNSKLKLTNCIIWNNIEVDEIGVRGASVLDIGPGSITYSHCLIENWTAASLDASGSGGINNFNGNDPANSPRFVAWVNPLDAPTTGGDVRLLTGSPAVDAGDGLSGASVNTTTNDLAGAPRFDGTIDLGAYEGAFTTFARAYPGLGRNGDKNLNGLTNFHDYAAGGDPTAVDDPSLRPATNGNQVTFSYRNNAVDVYTIFEKSPSLDPDSWTEMIEGTDYENNPDATIDGNRTLLSLDVFTPGSYLFFRQGFSETPW